MLADRGFDLVYLRRLPPKEMLAELARTMKPDARLVLASPDAPGETVMAARLGECFGAVRVLHPPNPDGLLARLMRRKQRGEAVFTARRAV
jgi:hypothetical protein